MITLPSIRSYGNYSSSNYGAHCLEVSIGSITVYFSYQTPVAFRTPGNCVVRRNQWGCTTGKHLNAIDGGNKKERVDSATFEKMLAEELAKREPK